MADYITQSDVQTAAGGEARLIGIADADRNGSVDTTLVDAAIEAAEAWANAELSKRVATPITGTVPQLVKDICAEEAVYVLKRRSGLETDLDRENHLERLELLKDIASGETTTGDDDGPEASSLLVDGTTTRSTMSNAVGRENLKGFA